MRKYLNYRQEMDKTFARPLFASVIMGAAAYGIYEGMSLLLEIFMTSVYFINLIALVAAVSIGAVLYFVLVIKLKAVKETELKSLPKGRIIVKMAKKLHLL